jgi:hypothetical protein
MFSICVAEIAPFSHSLLGLKLLLHRFVGKKILSFEASLLRDPKIMKSKQKQLNPSVG